MGANRPDENTSLGRGLLEVDERVLNAVAKLTDANGITLQHSHSGAAASQLDAENRYIIQRDYYFEGVVTQQRTYPAPRFLIGTAGIGSVTLSWTLPPDRFDRLRIVVRRAAGTTAPTSPTAGTGVTLSGDLATTVINSAAAGTYSYAVFAAYDEYGAAAPNAYSDPVTKTLTIVP
jgi:hypothetical protein